mgnify:CR=1 FL=1
MSESYVTTGTPAPLPADAVAEVAQDTPQAGVRFTPLRSAIVVRDRAARPDTGETMSPLVPVRRRTT